MKLRLLRFAARRPLAALALLAASSIAIGGAAISAFTASNHDAADLNPRLVLNRIWFDRLPEKRGDEVQFWLFFAGGVSLHEKGSTYRWTDEIFDFERQGDKLLMKSLHDGKSVETKFTITRCDEKPPFDVCLDLADSPRGPKRYYGFGDDDEESSRVPWARAMKRAAEGRAAIR